MKLSYRDKVIFVAAIVIVILVLGIFLIIKPKFQEMNSAKATLENKQTEKANVEAKINTLADIVTALKATAQEVGEIQEYFLLEQDPYLNEQYVREILGNKVETLSMNTTYTAASELVEYVVNPENITVCDLFINSDLYNELPQEVYDVYNQVAGKTGGTCVIGVTSMEIGYQDKINFDGLYKFIDAVKDEGKTIIVNSFSVSSDDPQATEVQSAVKLTLYSIYPLNVDKVMEESEEFVFVEPVAEEAAAQ